MLLLINCRNTLLLLLLVHQGAVRTLSAHDATDIAALEEQRAEV